MNKDISYKRKDFGFSYRVAAVITENGKALLQCFNGEYAFVGGQVTENELASDALKREFYEEVGAELETDEMCAVGETFFTWDSIPYHQIGLYIHAHLPKESKLPKSGEFYGIDQYENKKVNLKFIWIPLEDLGDIPLYPKEIITHIRSNRKGILHFISRD